MERAALLVIGAGPYGLATAAEARRRGIATLVVGEPMRFWRRNMPAEMLLRSGRDWHLDAAGVHTFDAWAEEPVDPIPVEAFIAYADWFAAREGIEVREAQVEALVAPNGNPRIEGDGNGLVARFQDGSTILADRVVAAPGIACAS